MPLKKKPIKKRNPSKVYLSNNTRDLFISLLDRLRLMSRENQTKILKQINSTLMKNQEQLLKEKQFLSKIGIEKKGTIEINEAQFKKMYEGQWLEKNKELASFLIILGKIPEEKSQKIIKDLLERLN